MHTPITCAKAPSAIGPYSQAILTADNRLFLSGQLGINPENGTMPDDFAGQTRQVMENLGQILRSAGFDFTDVVKTLIFLDDLKNFDTLNRIYAEYFKTHKPARSCVQVAGIPKGAKVEIELMAER